MSAGETTRRPLRLGVLVSGAGSTLANLVERIEDGRLRGIRIGMVISSRTTVRGVEVAHDAGLPLRIIRARDFQQSEAFSETVTAALDAAEVDLVVMAGFLCYWRIPPAYLGRTLNIHPALLPAFGGEGMYGRRVHEAVLAGRAAESGCTVHLADHEYDHGPILAQRRVAVRADDTPDTLAQRVGELERELYPEVIQQIAERGLEWLRARFESTAR